MPEIKSPIGSVSMSGSQLPTYTVDDPTIQEKEQMNLPIKPPVTSSAPQKITPEQYNEYKQQLEKARFTARSTNFDEPDVGERKKLTKEDEQMLGFMQSTNPGREQVHNLRKQVKKKETSISPETKQKVEILLGLGRKNTSLEIDDHEIVLQNLTSNQTKKVLNSVAENAVENNKIQFDQIYITKHMVIGFALKSIDGVNVSELLGDENTDEAREALIGEMDSDVVEKLYSAYIQNIGKTLGIDKDIAGEIKK
ncbi:MAG TPA: hypothetical protein VMX17_05985 [Candidatus Glassbacteria bacterium]|nr:hypothetical protein [Candidatus Glassbacteria bacterium]